MKKIIFLAMLTVIAAICFGQVINPAPPLIHDDLLLKSKNQRSTGGILTIGGSLVLLVGVGLLSSNILVDYPNSQEVKNRETTGLVLLIAGGTAIVGGIVLLTAGKRNRRKAATLELQKQNSGLQQNKIIRKVSYPAINFRLAI